MSKKKHEPDGSNATPQESQWEGGQAPKPPTLGFDEDGNKLPPLKPKVEREAQKALPPATLKRDRVLKDWISSFLEYSDETEAPSIFRKWTAVSCVAAAMKRKVFLPFGLDRYFANMYIVFVAPPGGKKGTAMRPARPLLDRAGIALCPESITREAFINFIVNQKAIDTDPNTNTQIIHCSATVFSQELTVFLGYQNLRLITDLCDMFDSGDNFIYMTKNSGTASIQGLWVNLCGATTPESLQESLPTNAIGTGLTSRIVFVYSDSPTKVIVYPQTDDKTIQLGEDLVTDLEQIKLLKGTFRFDRNWFDRYSQFAIQSESKPRFQDPRLAGYNRRRRVHILKLSMIMSVSRSDELILRKADIDRAISFLEEAEEAMPNVFKGVGRSMLAAVQEHVLASIMFAPNQTTTLSQLTMLHSYEADVQELSKVIGQLRNARLIQTKKQLNGDWEVKFIPEAERSKVHIPTNTLSTSERGATGEVSQKLRPLSEVLAKQKEGKEGNNQ